MRRALVLNATYEPLSVVSARRAVCLVLAEKAEVLHDDEAPMRSAHLELRTPLVIRLRYMVKVPYHRRTTLSRRAVFARDAHRCQYCGGHADSIDHVVPRSRGGEHVWENVAAACRPCNLRKRDRTPEEAGMRLMRSPRPPAGAGVGGGGGGPRARGVEAVPGQSQLTLGRSRRLPGSAAELPRASRCRRRRSGRCGSSSRAARRSCSARPSPARRWRRRPAGWRRGRCGGAAAGERCCSMPGRGRSGSTWSCPPATRSGSTTSGRPPHWLGEVWAAALARLRRDGATVHRGALVRNAVVGARVLRRAGPG